MSIVPSVSNEEDVVRILHQDWIVDGKIDVEVEPRATSIQSHAGIFTRIGSSNIKKGAILPAEALPLGLSADDILMEVGWSLIAISKLEEKTFKEK